VKQEFFNQDAPTERKNATAQLSQVLRGDWLLRNQSKAQRCFSPKEAPKRGLGQRPKVFPHAL